MLEIPARRLPAIQQRELALLQTQVNVQSTFAAQAATANDLWSNKPRKLFGQLKTSLITMCVGHGLCNYCEHNEATDIEHVLPDSLFPGWAFTWTNYLLACSTCNRVYKLDKIDVFVPAGSTTTVPRIRSQSPASQDVAFINPRLENPLDLLRLDFWDGQLYARYQPSSREFKKAECTLGVLQLNERASLVKYRLQAFRDYCRKLQEYVAVKQATHFVALEAAIPGVSPPNRRQPFQKEKQRRLDGVRKLIMSSTHPTVWREMVNSRSQLPASLQALFTAAPEALNW